MNLTRHGRTPMGFLHLKALKHFDLHWRNQAFDRSKFPSDAKPIQSLFITNSQF
jgi:hypothetical protein